MILPSSTETLRCLLPIVQQIRSLCYTHKHVCVLSCVQALQCGFPWFEIADLILTSSPTLTFLQLLIAKTHMQASAFFVRSAHPSAQDRQLQHDSLVRQLARPELSSLLGNRCT